MTTPLWVAELAAEFWADAGGPEAFPRSLRGPIARSSLDLTLEELGDLTTAKVERYLAVIGCPRRCGEIDRPLRACLVADNGGGFVFLDARDDAGQRAVSLAHELAHFLRHYLQPRRRAVRALGEEVLEVLDGRRPARPEERLHALLRGVPVGSHIHLMRRSGEYAIPEVDFAEREADLLAFELLAPAAEVWARAPAGASAGELADLLCRDFGLPASVAREYVDALAPCVESAPLLARLKKARSACRTSPPAGEPSAGGSRHDPSP